MKRIIIYSFIIMAAIVGWSCKKDDLAVNPNASGESSVIPAPLFFNRLNVELYNLTEGPWGQNMKWNQFLVSNYDYYQGKNVYTWSNSSTSYDMLKYVVLMDQQISKQYGTTANVYSAISKFYRAYSFIWYTQRVGDIPASQAGSTSNLTPVFDSQKDVYKNSLALLDTANTLISGFAAAAPNTVIDDVYGLTNLQWQKVINTYKLRVLISLSKRAIDNADMNIPQQFAAIVNDPVKYPIMTSNTDNLVYKYNTVNAYPLYNTSYNNYINIGKTYLDITTKNNDPRTFVVATPAPSQLTSGKTIDDFTAYIGADINTAQSQLFVDAPKGLYSYNSTLRYVKPAGTNVTNAESYIIFGYPEMCLNIAEAANRGWLSGVVAKSWYDKGINASLAIYGITDGKDLTVGDLSGATLGTVKADLTTFSNSVAYLGDNADGLNQILEQKYVAFFENSGFEAYYNWRRTGVPAFSQGGVGIGTPNSLIPVRFLYPNDSKTANTANYQSALKSQSFSADDVNAVMWLLK